MGVSGQLYNLPLPSGAARPAAWDVDLRDGCGSGSTSATTFGGKVVGNCITEVNEVELYGRKLIAGSIFSWPSIVEDLKGPTTSKGLRQGTKTLLHLWCSRSNVEI